MSTHYPFHLLEEGRQEPLADGPALLARRPFAQQDHTFPAAARRYAPGARLLTAMNASIALGEPLLITGEPGTGKTLAAYYLAYQLGLEPVLHFQSKSDSVATDLLYDFDAVRYFHDAQTRRGELPPRTAYIEPRVLWQAMRSKIPRVVLIDEIDKAPREFSNDLLHELDTLSFEVKETQEIVSASPEMRPLVVVTSNSERPLPDAFLRRTLYHHIALDGALVQNALTAHRSEAFPSLSLAFLDTARHRFHALRDLQLQRKPSTAELLDWLILLEQDHLQHGERPLSEDLAELPYLHVLIKNWEDLELLQGLPSPGDR